VISTELSQKEQRSSTPKYYKYRKLSAKERVWGIPLIVLGMVVGFIATRYFSANSNMASVGFVAGVIIIGWGVAIIANGRGGRGFREVYYRHK
jgi:hypothetical protein